MLWKESNAFVKKRLRCTFWLEHSEQREKEDREEKTSIINDRKLKNAVCWYSSAAFSRRDTERPRGKQTERLDREATENDEW